VPKNALAVISPQPDSRSSDAVVRRWIVAIAELCGKELTPPLVELWCQLLGDIDAALLDRALEETAKTCGRFFPTPGEVRARIEDVEAKGIELKAEEAWQRALSVAERDGNGFHALDAATQHAIRAAGGLAWIESCPRDELQWARKRFLEDYKLVRETCQSEHLLSDGEAKKILRQLASQPKPLGPKELPTVERSAAVGPLAPEDSIRADLAALRNKLNQPEPKPVMSEAEFQSRRELLKRQAAQLAESK
jgi:hypothetical protein